MRIKSFLLAATASIAALLAALPAQAEGWYAGAAFSWASQDNSTNKGALSENFATSPTTVIPAGSEYDFSTKFEKGKGASFEYGYAYPNTLRLAVEVSLMSADVQSHRNVQLGGVVIDGLDASVLTGSATPVGRSVGQVLSNDSGELKSLGAFANVYFDFNRGARFEPYIGAGLGLMDTEVTYRPSNIDIVDDSETKLAWQVRGGVTAKVSDPFEVFVEATYRQTEDLEFDNQLLSGALDVENATTFVNAGVRYRFSR